MPGGTDRLLVRMLFLSSGRTVSWNAAGAGCWVVFGTLLGPEATGPGWGSWLEGCGSLFPGLFVSGFLAAPSARLTPVGGCVWGVWFGVVV